MMDSGGVRLLEKTGGKSKAVNLTIHSSKIKYVRFYRLIEEVLKYTQTKSKSQ
jgi:hypothetical protein